MGVTLCYIISPPRLICCSLPVHDDVIKWKHFPRHWPYVRGIYRSPVNSPHKGQWRRALMLSLICAWINAWVNNCEAGDLRRHRTDYDVIVLLNCVGERTEHLADARPLSILQGVAKTDSILIGLGNDIVIFCFQHTIITWGRNALCSTHWSLENVAVILKVWFLNSLCVSVLLSGEWYRSLLMKSTLVQYLVQCWPRSMVQYGITRLQWANKLWLK